MAERACPSNHTTALSKRIPDVRSRRVDEVGPVLTGPGATVVFEPQVARLSPLPPLSGAIGLLLGLVVCALGFVGPAPTVELFACRHVTGWDGLAAHFGIPCNNGLQWLPSLFAAGRTRPQRRNQHSSRPLDTTIPELDHGSAFNCVCQHPEGEPGS